MVLQRWFSLVAHQKWCGDSEVAALRLIAIQRIVGDGILGEVSEP